MKTEFFINFQLDNTLQKNIQFINDSGPPPTLLPSGTYVDITTPAQGNDTIALCLFDKNCFIKSYTFHSGKGTQPSPPSSQTNQTPMVNKTTHITAKSEVSQSTAISDRPKAKPKNSRKLQQAQQQQQQNQSQVGRQFSGEILISSLYEFLANTIS